VPSTIHQVTFDCSDTYLLATFWAEVLGGSLHPDDQPGDPEALVLAPDGSRILLFQQVPEGKCSEGIVGSAGAGISQHMLILDRHFGSAADRHCWDDHRVALPPPRGWTRASSLSTVIRSVSWRS
jgi:hypothetical protein